jgi:hypothetical protein
MRRELDHLGVAAASSGRTQSGIPLRFPSAVNARTPRATSVTSLAYAWNESELAWPARRFLTCSSKLSLPNRETPSAIDEHSASSVT